MKHFLLLAALTLSACADDPAWLSDPLQRNEARTVQVMGRSWSVVAVDEETSRYMATRDNNNLNPFGRPAALRTSQAIRALEAATGCKVVRSSLYQNVSAQFFGNMACPVPAPTITE